MSDALMPSPFGAPARSAARHPRVVVTTVSSDSHTLNLVWVQMLMEELGCEVVNLGPCVPDELVVSTCLEVDPDLLLVSSVNGHGAVEGRRLMEKVRATPGLGALNAVIGGKLGIAGSLSAQARQGLLQAGFDLVISDSDASDLEALTSLACSGKRHEIR